MIRATFEYGDVLMAEITGHAGRINGEPIVCAKVSVLAQMLTEALYEYLGHDSESGRRENPELEEENVSGKCIISVDTRGISVQKKRELLLIFETARKGFELVQEQFPKEIVFAVLYNF